ncbi:MAG TPA: VOC family protein [Thermoplasmata archaeon]|nr:VOC family protein [Thermoplasmata archaeon]
MARPIQISFDCADVGRLSRFYAAALDYRPMDPPEGFPTWEAALEAWGVPREEWNDGAHLVDPEGKGPRIYFQRLDTPKPGKNRLHLDLTASGGRKVALEERRRRIDAEVERLVGLGAAKLYVTEEGQHYAVTMTDPEGNEFCVN